MNTYNEYFLRDRFATSNGIELVECRPGYAKAQLQVEDRHLNGADVVHGGVLFTLADFAFAAAVNSYGKVTLSINAYISYFKASSEGVLTAECYEISRSNRLTNCEINVYNEDKELLANFRGTGYITKGEINFNTQYENRQMI